MRHVIATFALSLLLAIFIFGQTRVFAQSVPNASRPVCAYCNTPLPHGVHAPSCPYYVSPKASPGRPSGHVGGNPQTQMMQMLLQPLFNDLFNPPSQPSNEASAEQLRQQELLRQQAAELQRAKAAAEQAKYDDMMRSYKQLDGGQGVAYKSLSDSAVGYKTLDGDAETLAAGARKPFDTPSDLQTPTSAPGSDGTPTPFFGDTMPTADIQLLVDPESNPSVVDLKNANTYVVANIKKDQVPVSGQNRSDGTAKGEPISKAPDCVKLSHRLDGLIVQRANFQKTIGLAQEQLQTWETANRNALVNAAKDGMEYYIGKWLTHLTKRGSAAERLQRVYEKNATQMAQEGLNVTEIAAKIKRLKATSMVGKLADVVSNASDWQSFIKNGSSSLLSQLSSSNDEVRQMLEDPKMQKYFETEAPELNTLLDISTIAAGNEVFGSGADLVPA